MLRIGELAAQYQIKTDTLRFYDKLNLLSPSSRSESGYRLYTEKDTKRLRFILKAKNVGFTLTGIAELLSLEVDKQNLACADVKNVVDAKLLDIQEKINELTVFKNSLQQLSDSCSGGQKSAVHCSILDTFKH